MKKLKQLLCLLLCLCTVMGMVTVPAFAVTKVTKFSIMVDEPKLGAKPADKGDIWHSNSEYFELSEMEWLGEMDANGNFKDGQAYGIKFTFKAKKPGEKIFGALAPEDFTVNEKKIDHTRLYSVKDDGKTMTLLYRFHFSLQPDGKKKELTTINSLSLTVPTPLTGATPATASQVKTGNSNVDVSKIEWIGELDANGKFKAGVKYKVFVTVQAKSTHMFNYSIGGTINTKSATNRYYTAQVYGEYALTYIFPATEGAEDISEKNNTRMEIAAPKIGEWPTYKPVIPADWNSYVSYCDWSGTFDKYGRFQTGKSYTLNVTVKAKPTAPNFKFAKGTTNLINGASATIKSVSDDGKTMKLSYTFPKLEGDAVAAPKGTKVEAFEAGDYGMLKITQGTITYLKDLNDPNSFYDYNQSTDSIMGNRTEINIVVLEANVKSEKGQTYHAVLKSGKIAYIAAKGGVVVTYSDLERFGNRTPGSYHNLWSSDATLTEGMIKVVDPDVLVLENNVPKLELRSNRSTVPGEAKKEFYLDTSATVYSTTKPEPYSFVTATATYRANPGYFFYEKITYDDAPLQLLQKGCAAQIKYVDKNTITVIYTIWVKDIYGQDSYTHDMKQFALSRTEFDEIGYPKSYGFVGGAQRQYVATAKFYNPLYEWYKTMNVPANLDNLYGKNFKLPVYVAPSDDAIVIEELKKHGEDAYLYAVDVNDMFPGGMTGEWCMLTGGMFIPKAMVTDINMAEANTVGTPGHRVNPVFSFAGGTGTKDDPYLIKTAEQLNAVRLNYHQDVHYKMIADIDLSGWGNWVPIGGTPAYGGWPNNSGYAHYNSFTFFASFDGNGHTVSGMTIKIDADKPAMYVSDVDMYFGLFAATSGFDKLTGKEGNKLVYSHWGEIKNLTVKDFNIDVTYRAVPVKAEVHAGGLAGLSTGTHITNCKSEGGKINIQFQRPEGKDHYFSIHAAGLVGVSRDAQFKNCSSNSTVNVRSSTYQTELFDTSEVNALVNKPVGKDSTVLSNSKGTGKVSLTNTAPAAATSKFNDVKTADYFYKPVEWAVGQAITAGVGNNNFGPNQTCTRAQIIMFLWRAVGCPKPKTANPFKDVKTTDYFYNAAIWAYNMGMVTGTEFKGDTPCTRSSTMTYIWKASGAPKTAASDKFKDVPATADYAQAVAWALNKGVTAGTSDTTFGSNDTCTRGQIATFLYRVFGTPLEKIPAMQ